MICLVINMDLPQDLEKDNRKEKWYEASDRVEELRKKGLLPTFESEENIIRRLYEHMVSDESTYTYTEKE